MNELFLGFIAAAVVVMAVVQVVVVIVATRAARNIGQAVSRLEQDVRPIVTNLQAVSGDAARAAASVSAQVERMQKTLDAVLDRVDSASVRVEQTLKVIQDGILAPAREGFSVLQAIRAFFSTSRPPRRSQRSRPAPTEDEDALFIG